ncbi:hypothetical protein H2201_002207 [Coniosporium apollinis]|uniref:Cytochrome P450 n=1 Tax=Coniosporium apollinis TaxID=61459 RepID=A0ABQ9P5L8_9PEZI|nr:hypothetical protein H2201_002207 [Coniosporium apollinis]
MSEVDPKRHIAKTKNIASGYAFSNVITAEPYVDDALRLLEEQLTRLSKSGQDVHLDHWFNYFGFDVLGEVTFSRRFGFLEEGKDIGGAIANTRFLGLYISVIGHFYWLHDWLLANPIIGWLNLQPSMHIFETCLAALDARSKSDTVRKDMLEQWKETRRKHPDRMEEKEILAAAVANIGAGADTISATLQALFYYLLQNQQAWTRVRAEVDEAHSRGELSDIVSHAEAQKLPYLQACIKETLRYQTPVAFGLPRVVPKEGVTVADRHFKEGVILSVNPWVIHRDPSLFGSDANDFNPDRWMDVERAKEMNKYMIPFGAGYNQCPGRHLAHMEVSKVSATLIRDFDIERTNPKEPWSDEAADPAISGNTIGRRQSSSTANISRTNYQKFWGENKDLDPTYAIDERFVYLDAYYNGTMSFSHRNAAPDSDCPDWTYPAEEYAALAIGDMVSPDDPKLNRTIVDANPFFFSLWTEYFGTSPGNFHAEFTSSNSELVWGQMWNVTATKSGDGFDLAGAYVSRKYGFSNGYGYTPPNETAWDRCKGLDADWVLDTTHVSMVGRVTPETAEMTVTVGNGTVRVLTYEFTGTWWNQGARLAMNGAGIEVTGGRANGAAVVAPLRGGVVGLAIVVVTGLVLLL